MKADFFKLFGVVLFFSLSSFGFKDGAAQDPSSVDLTFEFYYETLKPLKLQSATLYTLPSTLAQRRDSIIVDTDALLDTFVIRFPWKYPVNAVLQIQYEDQKRMSNKFTLDPSRKYWQVFVSDTAVVVHSQPRFTFSEKNSFMGIIVIIQGAIELLLALMFYKLFRWPSWVLLVVLVANLASFPVYMLGLSPAFVIDLFMLVVEFLVMMLISRRKLGIVRISILVITLNVISFGFKELFLLITNVL